MQPFHITHKSSLLGIVTEIFPTSSSRSKNAGFRKVHRMSRNCSFISSISLLLTAPSPSLHAFEDSVVGAKCEILQPTLAKLVQSPASSEAPLFAPCTELLTCLQPFFLHISVYTNATQTTTDVYMHAHNDVNAMHAAPHKLVRFRT